VAQEKEKKVYIGETSWKHTETIIMLNNLITESLYRRLIEL